MTTGGVLADSYQLIAVSFYFSRPTALPMMR